MSLVMVLARLVVNCVVTVLFRERLFMMMCCLGLNSLTMDVVCLVLMMVRLNVKLGTMARMLRVVRSWVSYLHVRGWIRLLGQSMNRMLVWLLVGVIMTVWLELIALSAMAVELLVELAVVLRLSISGGWNMNGRVMLVRQFSVRISMSISV